MPRYNIIILNTDQLRRIEETIEAPDLQDALDKFRSDFMSGKATPRPITEIETALAEFRIFTLNYLEGRSTLEESIAATRDMLGRLKKG